MKLWAFLVLTALAVGTAGAQDSPESAPVIARIEIQQNQFVDKDTYLFYISSKPGDRYDERRLRDDFRRLWETGFLDDMVLDVQDSSAGKVVTFIVRERKRIQVVDYRGSKALTTSNIEDELKKKELTPRVDSFYDPSRARQVEAVIKQMLVEKGRPFATVRHDAKPIGAAGTQLSFVIDDGPKAKVTKIEFGGNHVFSDGSLRRHMKKIKSAGFWNLSWVGGKSTYTPEKWSDPREGDRQRLQEFFLNRGYVAATVGEPKVTYVEGKTGKKPVKYVHLEIPVSEGDQYRVGEVKFEGLTVFKEGALRPLFKLKTGDVYRESRLKKGYDKLREAYGSQGYFQWTPLTKRTPDPQRKVVNVVLSMEEDKRYYVGKILFTGNDSTRDKVIRREVYLNEADVFNTEALKLSIRRINQLGYFKPMEGPPELSPSELGEDKIDITFKVQEQNRNQFTFGGGVSGYEGTFLNASFSTANFLGLGENFQLSAVTGRRTKNYQLSMTEPYLKDRPITAGFDVYKSRIEFFTNEAQGFQGYIDDKLGGGVTVGFPIARFTRVFAGYSYVIRDVRKPEEQLSQEELLFDPTRQFINRAFIPDFGRRRESTVSPSLVHNTVDNPYTPRSGKKLTVSLPMEGGPLGGTLDFFKPDIEAIVYLPHTKKTALGLRAQYGWIAPFARTAEIDPISGRNKLPFYQRFYMGGETQIRGYDIYRVGPRDANGVLIGGDKYALFNAEYYFDIGGPLRALLFFDAGQAYQDQEKVDFKKMRMSTGVEVRFVMPVLNVPFRLIYALNPNRERLSNQLDPTPKSTFKFAVGTTF